MPGRGTPKKCRPALQPGVSASTTLFLHDYLKKACVTVGWTRCEVPYLCRSDYISSPWNKGLMTDRMIMSVCGTATILGVIVSGRNVIGIVSHRASTIVDFAAVTLWW